MGGVGGEFVELRCRKCGARLTVRKRLGPVVCCGGRMEVVGRLKSTPAGVCEVCGRRTRGGGTLCYEHRQFRLYSGFHEYRYIPSEGKTGSTQQLKTSQG